METNYGYNAENFDEILSRLQEDEASLASNSSDANFEREFFSNNFSDIENLSLEELSSTNSGCCRNNNDSRCCRNNSDSSFSNFTDDSLLGEFDNSLLGNLNSDLGSFNSNFENLNSDLGSFNSDFGSCTDDGSCDFQTLSTSSSCAGVVNSRECFERGLRQGLEQGFIRGFRRGCQQGRNSGLREGFSRGLERGLSRAQQLARASFERGFRCGFERGFRVGYQRGFRDGSRAGFQRGVRVGFRRGYERAVRDIIRSINENFGRSSNCSCSGSNRSSVTNGNWRNC